MAEILTGYQYFPFTLGEVTVFLDPENEVNVSEGESKEIPIQNINRPMVQVNRPQLELTIPGLNEEQASAILGYRRDDVQRMIQGTKTDYADISIGAYDILQTYVSSVTAKANYTSYGRSIQELTVTIKGSLYNQ